jgi:hypothetical protein
MRAVRKARGLWTGRRAAGARPFEGMVAATRIGINGLYRFTASVRSIRRQLAECDGLVFMKFRGSYTLSGWAGRAER